MSHHLQGLIKMQISEHVLGIWKVSNKIPRSLQDFMENNFSSLKANEKKKKSGDSLYVKTFVEFG